MDIEPAPACCPRSEVGEGPVWDDRSQSLVWVGLTEGVVHRYWPGTRTVRSYPLSAPIGAVCPSAPDGFVALLQDEFWLVENDFRDRSLITKVPMPSGLRINDGKADPAGRLWAGAMPHDLEPGAGSLYVLEQNRAIEVMAGLGIPNGLDWSPDGTTFYLVDSAAQQVAAFDYDATTGRPSNGRVLIDVDPRDGMPDGLTVDADGALWVALWEGAAVRRYSAAGELLDTFALPASQVTSCAFGGPERDLLFITTARYRLTPEQVAAQPLAGSLFVARPGPLGRAPHAFTP